MINTKRMLVLLLVAAMFASLAVGCGSGTSNSPTTASSSGTSAATAASSTEATKAPVTLTWAMQANLANQDAYKDLMALEEKLTGYKIEPILLPGADSTAVDAKLLTSLMAGDPIDILYTQETSCQKYTQANLFLPLDDIMAKNNYDAEKVFGSALKKYNGKVMFLPSQKDTHITIYNKKIFDDAHVPYPDNATWTWDKYLETAKKLTDPSKGIYGSYMLDWDTYFTFSAKQKKVPAYKPDGTSNFDDPAWAESMKFFGDLGNVYKVQPDFRTYRSKKMQYDAFSTGKYGMWVVGNWALCIPADKKTYPRDWKIGVAIMPQVQAGQRIALSITGGYCIPTTSKHVQEAFEAVKAMAENEWTLPYGRVPARVDLTKEQTDSVASMLLKGLPDDGITPDQIKDAMLDNMDLINEKIVGKGMTTIDTTLITNEGELYATGQRTLEQTMKEMKEKADAAIAADK